MDLSLWPTTTHDWPELARTVSWADGRGFYAAYVADHFMPNDPHGAAPQDGPMLEGTAVLAALAASTQRLRLGTLVLGNLYRHPAVVANTAATVDHISGGRAILGLGAGWQANEHAAYGIDLLDTRARLDRFEEACRVVRGLLRDARTTMVGTHYRVVDAPCEPKPVQPALPLLIGGGGEQRTLRIVARYGDAWNTWSTPEVFRHKSQVLERHCAAEGRDPATIRRSTQAVVVVSTDPAVLEQARGREARYPMIVGTPPQVVEALAGYAAAGVDEFIVPDWAMGTGQRLADALELFASDVAPHLG